ncbi:hypothetical protein SDC9_171645 [bioreactor metagenome]|uniref:Uncharacterized protein n=1 Tax=bioreactor metagenome TaxID=1076179 RepID=A0A645GDU2_9ZZZZ
MICAVHCTPIGIEPCVAGSDGIEADCLAGIRFFVLAVDAHAQSCAAIFVIIEDGHDTAGES